MNPAPGLTGLLSSVAGASAASILRRAQTLSRALDPGAIAVIGASENSNKIGGRPIKYLTQFGYKGRLYPINPTRQQVQGFAAYRNVAALPEVPDLAIIAVPSEHAAIAVEECAALGVRCAVLMAAGFAETNNPASIALERAMTARAHEAGMRLVGPNCQGLANFATGAVASFSTMFAEVAPMDGPVAVISQSGIMSVVPYGLLRDQGFGLRHAHATGNECDVTLAELAIPVIQDEGVRLLLLYMETIRDPATLSVAASLARDRDLPIVALKAGRTARGQAAARSHTAALATEDRVVDAFLRDNGIWRVHDLPELVRTTELYLKGWRPRGRNLVVISNSGASCVMAADLAEEQKLCLAPLLEDTVAAIAARLPSFATASNPVDLTAALLTNSRLFTDVLPILASDPTPDMFFIALPVAGAGYEMEVIAQDAARFAASVAKPVAVAAFQPGVARQFRNAGLPTFASETDAIAALAQLTHHVRLMRPRRGTSQAADPVPLPSGDGRFLSEAASLEVLRACSMPVVPHQLCVSERDARDAFRRLRGPVALKLCSSSLPHKSEHGLVLLDVDGEDAVAEGFSTLMARADTLRTRAEGVIVAKMVAGHREFVIGARMEPLFGPLVVVGDGGKFAETLDDVAILFPPFDVAAAREALGTLRVARFLDGARDQPPLDVDALCDVAARLSGVIIGLSDRVSSIDLNPVIVGAAGQGATIVDALIERTQRSPADETTSGTS